MWIVNKYGAFINLDYSTCIFYNEESDRTMCDLRNQERYHLCDGNYVEDIIRNIASGTKIMEVR